MSFPGWFRAVKYRAALFAFLCCFAVKGQSFQPAKLKDPEPFYRNIDASNGLPSSETYDLHQDSDGYVWIATDRGVVRYDGFRFRTFTTKDGLADDVIFKFYEDPFGRIWFISYNGLLSYYDHGKIRKYRYNSLLRNYIGKKITTFKSLVVDKYKTVYYGVSGLGGIQITAAGKWKYYPAYSFHVIRCPRIGNERVLIAMPSNKAGSGKNWYLLNDKNRTIAAFDEPSRTLRVITSPGYVFVQLNDDIIDYNAGKKVFSEKNIISLRVIGEQLFTGMFKGGVRLDRLPLLKGDRKQSTLLLNGLSVSSVIRDREGGYWFTTLEKGIFYTPNLNVRSYTEAQGLTGLEYSAFTTWHGDVYLAGLSGVVKLVHPAEIFNPGTLWKRPSAGATKRKLFFGTDQSKLKVADNIVFLSLLHWATFSTPEYVLTAGGLVSRIYDDEHEEILYWSKRKEHSATNFFYAVTETPQRKVYVGNPNGLYEIRDKMALQGELKDPLFRERVVGLAQHPFLKTVVATRNKGIYCFDENHCITRRFTEKDGLLSELINCVYVDRHGYLYVGTNRGLTIIEPQKEPVSGWRHWIVTTNQGLCSNEITSICRNDGIIYIATKEGVSMLDLGAVSYFKRGGIGMAGFYVNGHLAKNKPLLSLPSNVQIVKVMIRTDNFSGIGRHRFRYRLRPGGKWISTGDPEIALNEPRWGDYDITVKFRNDTGAWSRPVSLIRFSVEAPFYAKWYFLLLLSAGFAAIVFWIFRIVLRRVQQRHAYQTTINDLTQRALRAQMNPHFIFNSLNSIQSFLVFEENEKAEKYLLKFAQLIRQTLNNSRESYITIESEMDTLRRYLELEQMRFKDKFTFRITGNLSREELLCGVPPMLIQPFVENAVLHGFRHIESGGLVQVTFELRKDRQLLCTVEDNGAGRNATARDVSPAGHQSFGTKITEERLSAFRQKYGNDFAIEITDKQENGKAAGTKVVIRIPIVLANEIVHNDEV